jgi:hypothetical protein
MNKQYRCENCRKQDKIESPSGWELTKRLAKGVWNRYVLRRKPDTRYRTFPLPRFWCVQCNTYVARVIPLAITGLEQSATLLCHGESTVSTVTFVESLVSNPCCRRAFHTNKAHDGYTGFMVPWLDELDAVLKASNKG